MLGDLIHNLLIFVLGAVCGAALTAAVLVYMVFFYHSGTLIAFAPRIASNRRNTAPGKVTRTAVQPASFYAVEDMRMWDHVPRRGVGGGPSMSTNRANDAPPSALITRKPQGHSQAAGNTPELTTRGGGGGGSGSVAFSIAPHTVIKQGHIDVVGGRFKLWKRRHVILVPGNIHIYENATDERPLRTMALEGIQVRRPKDGKRHSFVVIQPSTQQVDYFSCVTAELAEDWMEAITRAAAASGGDDIPLERQRATTVSFDSVPQIEGGASSTAVPISGGRRRDRLNVSEGELPAPNNPLGTSMSDIPLSVSVDSQSSVATRVAKQRAASDASYDESGPAAPARRSSITPPIPLSHTDDGVGVGFHTSPNSTNASPVRRERNHQPQAQAHYSSEAAQFGAVGRGGYGGADLDSEMAAAAAAASALTDDSVEHGEAYLDQLHSLPRHLAQHANDGNIWYERAALHGADGGTVGEPAEWLNVLLPLFYHAWYEHEKVTGVQTRLGQKFEMRLNHVDKPNFIGTFEVTKFKLSVATPVIQAIRTYPYDPETGLQELRLSVFIPGTTRVAIATEVFGSVPVTCAMDVFSMQGEVQVFLPSNLDHFASVRFLHMPHVHMSIQTSIGNKQQLKNLPLLGEYIETKFYNSLEQQWVVPRAKFMRIPILGRSFYIIGDDELAVMLDDGQTLAEIGLDEEDDDLDLNAAGVGSGLNDSATSAELTNRVAANALSAWFWMGMYPRPQLQRVYCLVGAEGGTHIAFMDGEGVGASVIASEPLAGLSAMEGGPAMEHGVPWYILRKDARLFVLYATTDEEKKYWIEHINEIGGLDAEWQEIKLDQEQRAARAIQAAARRMMAVARYQRIIKRKEMLSVIVAFQGRFVDNLNDILKHYLQPLHDQQSAEEPILPKNMQLSEVFGRVADFYVVHRDLLHELEDREANWSVDSTIGDVFERLLIDSLSLYKKYTVQLGKQLACLQRWSASYIEFREFLQNVCDNGYLPLDALLRRPLTGLEKYMILLTNVNNETDQFHPDRPLLNSAINRMNNLTAYINKHSKDVPLTTM